MALTKARLLKHDLPVHGVFPHFFWGGGGCETEFCGQKLDGHLGFTESPCGPVLHS